MIRALAPFVVAIAGVGLLLAIRGSEPQLQALALPVLLSLALATTISGMLLPRLVARLTSLRHGIVVVALAAMLTTSGAIAVTAGTMLLEPPDLLILGVLVVIGASLGIILEYNLARDIVRDLRTLRLATSNVTAGDLTARASLERRDELGAAGRALDVLADRLTALEGERSTDRSARRAFLSSLGHDLRTPLTALLATVEALEDGVAPDPERYLASMRQDVEAIGRLVDDLFVLARIESGSLGFERIPSDLTELVDDAVEALAPTAARKRMTLRVETMGRVLAVVGPGEFSRVVRNLLDNAIRHADPGSEVVVRVGGGPAGAVVHVVDQGPGFTDEVREHLFDGAGSASIVGRHGEGSGLGLAIAKGLVDAHGGQIWAERGPGGHVAFRI